MKYYQSITFLLLISILICLEIISSNLGYENYGWLTEAIITLALFLNLIPIFLFFFGKKIIATSLCVLIGISIIPYQFILHCRHMHLKEEAANITNFIYQKRLVSGKFPQSILDYKFKFPELKGKIDYFNEGDDFLVIYSVGTQNTSHYFRHSYGSHWLYYDD